jgi:hypothetical protein
MRGLIAFFIECVTIFCEYITLLRTNMLTLVSTVTYFLAVMWQRLPTAKFINRWVPDLFEISAASF